MPASFDGVAVPSPPDEIDVPTNSVATARLSKLSKLTSRSLAQLLWMSPARTIGLAIFRSVKNLRMRRRRRGIEAPRGHGPIGEHRHDIVCHLHEPPVNVIHQ